MDRPLLMLCTHCVQERNLRVISRWVVHRVQRHHKSLQRCRLKSPRTFTHQQSWLFFITIFASYWKQAIQDTSINIRPTKWMAQAWTVDQWLWGRPIRRRRWETPKNCRDRKPAVSRIGHAGIIFLVLCRRSMSPSSPSRHMHWIAWWPT